MCWSSVLILLSASVLSQVRGAVMTTVAAVQLEDLPVVVKFILHSISASDANEVWDSEHVFELAN